MLIAICAAASFIGTMAVCELYDLYHPPRQPRVNLLFAVGCSLLTLVFILGVS